MRLRRCLAAIVVLAAVSGTAIAEEPVSPLADLLPLMPQTAAIYDGLPIFSYLDLRALERAAGVPTPESEAAFDAWPPERQAEWVDAMNRITHAPQWLTLYFGARGSGSGGMAAAVGFDMFAVDRSFMFGMRPDVVTVLAGDAGLAETGRQQAALTPRGFALETVGSVPVWHRLEDHEIDFEDVNAADPFGGDMGRPARIAILPETLVSASSWPVLRQVLEAPGKQRRRGGELATMLRAAVDAVIAFGGSEAALVQVEALPLDVTAEVLPMSAFAGEPPQEPEVLAELQKAKLAATPGGPALPSYPLAVLADLQVGADQVNVIALPYGDAAAAATAADILIERLRGWAIPNREAEGPLVARVGGIVEARTFAVEGVSVAVVAVRYPLPDPAVADAPKVGTVLRIWQEAILRYEFGPLAVVQ